MTLSISKKFLTPNKFSRPQTKIGKIKGVVIHWVANPMSKAIPNRNFFENRKSGNSGYGSAHYIVGLSSAEGIVQALPENELGYHVGSSVYTKQALQRLGSYPNNSTIGIECTHLDTKGNMSEYTYNATLELAVDILKRNGLNENDLWLHQTVVGWKDCHRFFVNNNAEWVKFKTKAGELLRGKATLNPEVDVDDIDMVKSDENGIYEVKRGDSLWGISQAFDTTVEELIRMNPNVKSSPLAIGYKMRVEDKEEEKKSTPKIVKVTGDVWLHKGANLDDSSRVRILKQGEQYKMYGESNGMYNLGGGLYVSKKYIEVVGNIPVVPTPAKPKVETPKATTYATVKFSQNNEDVKKLQALLKQRGYSIVADGIFGVGTDKAVKEFQRANGLTVDGIVGQGTWKELLDVPNYYGIATGDVWMHSKADFKDSTRTRILEKGEKIDIEDSSNADMHKTDLGYVSKKFILLKKI